MEAKDRQTNHAPSFSDNQDDWQIVRNGIDFFRRYFAKEYMVLLDLVQGIKIGMFDFSMAASGQPHVTEVLRMAPG